MHFAKVLVDRIAWEHSKYFMGYFHFLFSVRACRLPFNSVAFSDFWICFYWNVQSWNFERKQMNMSYHFIPNWTCPDHLNVAAISIVHLARAAGEYVWRSERNREKGREQFIHQKKMVSTFIFFFKCMRPDAETNAQCTLHTSFHCTILTKESSISRSPTTLPTSSSILQDERWTAKNNDFTTILSHFPCHFESTTCF